MAPISLPVSDSLSNYNDQLATGARLLGRSDAKIRVFETIYKGKKEVKTIQEIMKSTGLSQIRVLNEGGKLAGLLVEKVPNGYKKIKQFSPRYKDIIRLAKNPKKLEKLPTKTSHKISEKVILIQFPESAQNAKFITLSDVSSFSKVKNSLNTIDVKKMMESEIKDLFKKILGEQGDFKDWGGEKSDLFSTKLKLQSKRLKCAIAFKGRGTSGKLVPKKMGKNGDQIGRLFDEPADVYFIVYNGQIDSSIISQMQAFAVSKAISGQKIYYGIIDESDLGLLVDAYK